MVGYSDFAMVEGNCLFQGWAGFTGWLTKNGRRMTELFKIEVIIRLHIYELAWWVQIDTTI